MKCTKAYYHKQGDMDVIYCRIDSQMCGYQFFCGDLGLCKNLDDYKECKRYKEGEKI